MTIVNTKPEHAAFISKQAAFFAPILSWIMQEVAGNAMSGVMVAVMIRSMSSGVSPASLIASLAASTPRSLVATSLEAMRLSLIPVREVIHSSEVSTIFARSLFVNFFGGR